VSSSVAPARDAGWQAALPQDRRATALVVAGDVAARVTDRGRLLAAIATARTQTSFPEAVHWEPHAIAQGDAGLALLCGYLDRCFPGDAWDLAAHDFLSSAGRGAEHETAHGHVAPGLFSGLGGLAFTAAELARDGQRYGRLLRAVEQACLPVAEGWSRSLRGRAGLSVSHFDLISGLAGIGAHLLGRREQPGVEPVLTELLAALVELTTPDAELPRWFTPPQFLYDEATVRMYPHGNLNCGLAHGIPGPLALMALALADGVDVTGLAGAVAGTAQWLAAHRCDDEWGVNWPTAVALPAPSPASPSPAPDMPGRAAWCYGSPGVARALWLAGEALGDTVLCELAVEAMKAVYRRPLHAREIDSPTFCHGVAGLLQITLRFAHDTRVELFTQAAAALTDQLLQAYDPDRLLGFCSEEPGGNLVDQAGLLDGAAGVALVLLAAATDVEPTWDRAFLLS
jgi:hypothetical protein